MLCKFTKDGDIDWENSIDPEDDEELVCACPVCGQITLPFRGSFYTCENCGWEDDPVQEKYPDETDCANKMSFNQARAAYKRKSQSD